MIKCDTRPSDNYCLIRRAAAIPSSCRQVYEPPASAAPARFRSGAGPMGRRASFGIIIQIKSRKILGRPPCQSGSCASTPTSLGCSIIDASLVGRTVRSTIPSDDERLSVRLLGLRKHGQLSTKLENRTGSAEGRPKAILTAKILHEIKLGLAQPFRGHRVRTHPFRVDGPSRARRNLAGRRRRFGEHRRTAPKDQLADPMLQSGGGTGDRAGRRAPREPGEPTPVSVAPFLLDGGRPGDLKTLQGQPFAVGTSGNSLV